MTQLTVSLVIPSVNRPESLATALASVDRHGQRLTEVIVVARADDKATQEVARSHGARVTLVQTPGLAHAMQAGARASTSDVVAFTDDDAELLAGWFDRLERHYRDPAVGAVGGRDVQRGAPATPDAGKRVGTIRRFGQVVGGHHVALGAPRQVTHLKGVNCSFRRTLFTAYDASALIEGTGAQSRNELVACLGVRALGHRLVFDPELQVQHSPADRAAGDTRAPSTTKIYESVFNEALAFHLARHEWRWRNSLVLALVGYRSAPGLLRLAVGARPDHVRAVLRGLRDGINKARRNEGLLTQARNTQRRPATGACPGSPSC